MPPPRGSAEKIAAVVSSSETQDLAVCFAVPLSKKLPEINRGGCWGEGLGKKKKNKKKKGVGVGDG